MIIETAVELIQSDIKSKEVNKDIISYIDGNINSTDMPRVSSRLSPAVFEQTVCGQGH